MGACASGGSSPRAAKGLGPGGGTGGAEFMRISSAFDTGHEPNRSKAASGRLGGVAVGFACRRGLKAKPRQPNQDSWSAFQRAGHISVYGVFDGHGDRGHIVSNQVKDILMSRLTSDKRVGNEGEVAAALKDAFRKAHGAMESSRGANYSGTTATVVVHDASRGKLTVSHVGDSAAVLGRFAEPTVRLVAVRLTRDHKPALEDEASRILQRGGTVRFDGHCKRVYKKGASSPGLNMTRSIGDVFGHAHCGIIAEPEVAEHSLSRDDQVLLLCSDGIWDLVTPAEAVGIIAEYAPMRAMDAAARLADTARARWLRVSKGAVVDDITVVVVYLQEELGRSKSFVASSSVSTASTCAGSGASGSPDMNSWTNLPDTQTDKEGASAVRME